MSRFFRPYEGTRPYLFISYAHLQSVEVVETIRILHEKGYRLWYDEGIPAGSDWPANIAQHMEGCERVVFFLSARSMESPNCFSEMRTAFRQNKPVLVVDLEDAEKNETWRELLDGKQELPLMQGAEERADAILRSGFVPRRYHHSWTEKISWRALGLVASLLFFFAAAGALSALASGRWNPVQPPEVVLETPVPTAEPTPVPTVSVGGAERFFAVSFPDSLQERAIRRALGNTKDEVYRWQLAEIGELYLCGGVVTDSFEAVSFDADGSCRVNGAPVKLGPVTDLSLLENALQLEKLGLICQPLKDISALSGHLLLRELSLAGSTVDDIGSLQELPSLETLHLEHTAVKDLRPLEGLGNLKTVTVSRDMLPLQWSDTAPFTVVLVK